MSQLEGGLGDKNDATSGQEHDDPEGQSRSFPTSADCSTRAPQYDQQVFSSDKRRLGPENNESIVPGASKPPDDPSLDHAPPVTARTLRELEISQIVCNPRLRHDINFDPNLHFKPNTEGEKGRCKKQKADAYWAALGQEFQACAAGREASHQQADLKLHKIPQVFSEVQAITNGLIPECDKPIVAEMLDASLLLQQVRFGTLNYLRLASSLARILKTHCAPMRDKWVDEMVEQFREGTRTGQVKQIAGGVRMLFGVLESMKLDVANHQIRTMRPLLIQDAEKFEHHYFLRRITSGRLDITAASEWYTSSEVCWGDLAQIGQLPASERPRAVFLKGLVHLLAPSTEDEMPNTFAFDLGRLANLKSSIHVCLALDICVRTLERFAREDAQTRGPLRGDVVERLRKSVLSLLSESEGATGHTKEWMENVDKIALEIGRRVQEMSARSVPIGRDVTDRIQRYLQVDLQPQSSLWQDLEATFLQCVWSKTLPAMVDGKISPLEPDRANTKTPILAEPPTKSTCSCSSIATPLARMASLHWQVFGPLVYSVQQEEEEEIKVDSRERNE